MCSYACACTATTPPGHANEPMSLVPRHTIADKHPSTARGQTHREECRGGLADAGEAERQWPKSHNTKRGVASKQERGGQQEL